MRVSGQFGTVKRIFVQIGKWEPKVIKKREQSNGTFEVPYKEADRAGEVYEMAAGS